MAANDGFEVEFRLRDRPSIVPERHGAPSTPASRNQLSSAARALCLALYMQDLVARGEAKNYAEVARLLCTTRERVSQLTELCHLAPEIQLQILQGTPEDVSEADTRMIAKHILWSDQLALWNPSGV